MKGPLSQHGDVPVCRTLNRVFKSACILLLQQHIVTNMVLIDISEHKEVGLGFSKSLE